MKTWQIVLLIIGGFATICLLAIAAAVVLGFFQLSKPSQPSPVAAAASPIPAPTLKPVLPPAATHDPGPTVTPPPTSILPTFTQIPPTTAFPSLTPIIQSEVITGSNIVSAECIPQQTPQVGVVANVIDAENIEVVISGNLFPVKYIGIDAPQDEPYTDRAVQLNRTLVFGQTVSLYLDQTDKDPNGKLLRYVMVRNQFVNGKMIVEGLAQSHKIPPDTSCAVYFDSLQEAAQLARVGMWTSSITPTAPFCLGAMIFWFARTAIFKISIRL